MITRLTDRFPQRERGVSLLSVLIAVAIVVAVAIAVWLLIIRPHRALMQASQPVVTKPAVATTQAPPPADVEAMSTAELLAEASKAIEDKRLLSPSGNNAFEFYLKVLDRQPDNQAAKEALRETFPFAASAAEQVINEGNFAQADREIALLAEAAPNNYTLTILRSKLDARRRVKAEQAQEAELAAQQADQRRKAQAAAAVAKQQQLAEQQSEAAAAAARARQQQARQLAAQDTPAQTTPTPTPEVVIQNPVRVKYVEARYPTAARRMQREGWVVVEFTVGTDGQVHDAHVVQSDPGRVFDRAAIRAVTRWEYKPALRNGKPFAVTLRRRINFELRGN